jgi:hypothetical protein
MRLSIPVFFVYLPEGIEKMSIGDFLMSYFQNPSPQNIAFIQERLALEVDNKLPQKYELLRSKFTGVNQGTFELEIHINHGPNRVLEGDSIYQHLGTSVWDTGEYDDKILDLVLDFKNSNKAPASILSTPHEDFPELTSDAQKSKNMSMMVVGATTLLVGGVGAYYLFSKDPYTLWSETDAAIGMINLDDVLATFSKSKSFKQFSNQVNNIYEGEELLLVDVSENLNTQEVEIVGWADLDQSKTVDPAKDEKLFKMIYKNRQVEMIGFGVNSYYSKRGVPAVYAWDLEKEQQSSDLERRESNGRFHYIPSVLLWSTLLNSRNTYRNSPSYNAQLTRNGEYNERMSRQYGGVYTGMRGSVSSQRQSFMSQQKISGGFQNSYAHRVGGTGSGGSFRGGGV